MNFINNKYFTLNEANSKVRRFQYVFAMDHARVNGSFGKVFLVGSVMDLYNYLLYSDSTQNIYEIIPDEPCKFYLDIEVSQLQNVDISKVNTGMVRLTYMGIDAMERNIIKTRYLDICGNPWSVPMCRYGFNFLQASVTMLKNDLNFTGNPIYLSACRNNKFSYHVIFNEIIVDKSSIGGKNLVYEMARKFWFYINLAFSVELRKMRLESAGVSVFRWTEKGDMLLRFLMLEKQVDDFGFICRGDTPIDEMVYTKNRQFRIVGNGKCG